MYSKFLRLVWLSFLVVLLVVGLWSLYSLLASIAESASEPRAQWETWPKSWGQVKLWSPEPAVGSATFVVWAWNADAGFSRLGEYRIEVLSGPRGETNTARWSHPQACGVTGTVRLTRYPGWGGGFAFGCVVATPQPPAPTRTPRPPTPTPKPGEPTRTPVPPQPTSTPGPQPTATPPVGGEPSASTNVPLVLRYLLCEGDGCRRVKNYEVDFRVTSVLASLDGKEIHLKSKVDFSMDLNPSGEVSLLFDPRLITSKVVRWDGSWYWNTLTCMIQPAASKVWPLEFWPTADEQFLLAEELLAKHGWVGQAALCQSVVVDSREVTQVIEFRSRPATQ